MSDDRIVYIRGFFSRYPDFFPENRRHLIEKGIVSLGMSPFEAKLAGGSFSYKVIADPENWPAHSDPLAVMWRQSVNPDNSKIWMFFCNFRQFCSSEKVAFSVRFEQGRAVEIVTTKPRG